MAFRIRLEGANKRLVFPWSAFAAKVAEEVGAMGVLAIKDAAPVAHEGGGRLRDSIMFHRNTKARLIEIIFTADTPYAKWVIEGTQPHIIEARNVKALRFEMGGEINFATSVNHPGTFANPFPERAMRRLEPIIQLKMADLAKKSIRST